MGTVLRLNTVTFRPETYIQLPRNAATVPSVPRPAHRFEPRPSSSCISPFRLITFRTVPSRHVPRLVPSRLVSSRSIPSHLVPSRPVSSCPIPSRLVSSRLVPSHPIRPVSYHPIPSHPVPSRLVPSRLIACAAAASDCWRGGQVRHCCSGESAGARRRLAKG